jgi:hypothetical protein
LGGARTAADGAFEAHPAYKTDMHNKLELVSIVAAIGGFVAGFVAGAYAAWRAAPETELCGRWARKGQPPQWGVLHRDHLRGWQISEWHAPPE